MYSDSYEDLAPEILRDARSSLFLTVVNRPRPE